MGEKSVNPKSNIFKNYKEVIYVNPYLMNPPEVLTANTFIGGVASTIYTPALLSLKISIDVSRISLFSILGSDIQCRITGSYVCPSWLNDVNITSYDDRDGLVTDFVSFSGTTNYLYLNFPGIINLTGIAFFKEKSNGFRLYMPNCLSIPNNFLGNLYATVNKKVLYIPRCTGLGTTKLKNSLFNENMKGVIYAPASEQTSNAGGVEGDLAYAISQGANVIYVTNFTAPDPVTTLASGTIYGTAIQLNFTPPSSTNAIDYYECYANGVFKNDINASGGYITGLNLNTVYNITVIAVDIFYNKSIASNIVTQTTSPTLVYQDYLVSYYKMQNNAQDSWGVNNGTATGITYAGGKVSQTAFFNGSGFVKNTALITYDSFTICALIKTTSSGEMFIYSNRNAANGNPILAMQVISGKLFTRIRSSSGSGITSFYSINSVNSGSWKFVCFRFDITTGLQSNFIDGVLDSSTLYTGGVFGGFNVATIGVEASTSPSYGKFNGNIDEVSIFKKALSDAEILEIAANLNSGQSLI